MQLDCETAQPGPQGQRGQMDPETLYRQLGRLLETVPQFPAFGDLNADQQRWLGRARALVNEVGDPMLIAIFEQQLPNMYTALRQDTLQQILQNLYNTLAAAELKAPASAQGAFIPARNSFDAFTAINKVLQSATADVLIVDPYLDEKIGRAHV